VLSLSGLGTGTVRLVLAGTALMLGLNSLTEGLLLFPQQTEGLYQWNQGSIGQNGFDGVLQMLPVVATGLVGLLLTARRVDALALGDDAARGLGVPVRATRVTVVVLATLLSAAAVTLAGRRASADAPRRGPVVVGRCGAAGARGCGLVVVRGAGWSVVRGCGAAVVRTSGPVVVRRRGGAGARGCGLVVVRRGRARSVTSCLIDRGG
jgi:hypothetical protein